MTAILKNILIMLPLLFASTCGTKQPKEVDETKKKPVLTRSHLNLKTNCADCHSAEAPEADKAEPVIVLHGESQPCEKCHTWPLFKTIVKAESDHDPAPKTCLGCHTRKSENSCHPAQGDCKLCHSVDAWSPALVKADLCP